MSETMVATLIGACVTLVASVATMGMNAWIAKSKSRLKIQLKEYEEKRKYLSEIYEKLIHIINSYPNVSPKDIVKYIEPAPGYSSEHFSSVLKTLDYQIEHYKSQLEDDNITYREKNDIDTEISNREYAKTRITKVRDKYYTAKNNYKTFCESDKAMFDLYAGQNVRSCLEKFEMVIHNIFVSGHLAGGSDDPLSNTIEIYRRNLINSMRRDLRVG